MKNLSSPIEIIKKSVQIFSKKENLIYFAKIYAILVPFSIFFTFQGMWINPNTLQATNVWLTVTAVVVNLIYAFIVILVETVGIEAVRRVVSKEKLDYKSTFSTGLKKYWSFALLSVLLVLIIGFGFVLLIVPGVMFLTWFSLSKFLFMDKKMSVKEALTKSKELVKGKFWKVFGRLLVFGIFAAIVSQIVEFIPYGVGSALDSLLGALFLLPTYFLYKELSA